MPVLKGSAQPDESDAWPADKAIDYDKVAESSTP
jgi:hypothetical protein